MGKIKIRLILGLVLFTLLLVIFVNAEKLILPDEVEVNYVDYEQNSDYKTYVIYDPVEQPQKAKQVRQISGNTAVKEQSQDSDVKTITQAKPPIIPQQPVPVQIAVDEPSADPQNFPLSKYEYLQSVHPELFGAQTYEFNNHLPYEEVYTLDTVNGWNFDSSFNYTIYQTPQQWQTSSIPRIFKIYNSTTIYAFGGVNADPFQNQLLDYAAIFRKDGTQPWQWIGNTSQYTGPSSTIDMMSNVGFLTDYYGTSLFKWNGATWTLQSSLGQINDVDIYSTTLGFAAGPSGKLLKWDGTNWANETSIVDGNTTIPLSSYTFTAVKIVGPSLAFAVANHVQQLPAYQSACGWISPKKFREKIFKWNGATWNLDYYHESHWEANNCNLLSPVVQTSLYDIAATSTSAIAVGANGRVAKWNGASWQDYSGPDEAQMSAASNGSVFWLSNTFTTYNLLSAALLNDTFGYTGGDFPNKYVFRWDGSLFNQETYPLSPFDQAYLQQFPSSTTPYHSVVHEIELDSGSRGYFIDQYTLYKLGDAPPSLNIPDQNIQRNTPANINLNSYASDPNGYSLTFSMVSDDPNKVDCTIAGSTLTMTPAMNFTGSSSCAVAADNGQSSATDQFIVNVVSYLPDMAVAVDDVQFTNTNPTTINITVRNTGTVSTGNFDVQLLDVYRNQVVNTQTITFSSIASGGSASQSVNFGQFRGHTLKVFVDPNGLVEELSDLNNGAEKKFFNGDVYLDVNVANNVNSVFTDYLKSKLTNYNVLNNINNAYYVIHVTNNYNPNYKFGCKDGKAYLNDKIGELPYNGVVYPIETNGQLHLFLCGADIDGFVAAARNLNTLSLDSNKPYFVDRDNVEGISVYDFMHLGSNLAAYNNRGSSGFVTLVNQSLSGRFGSTDETVKTNDNIILRLKHITPIQSVSFLDYLFGAYYYTSYSTSAPVVLARGLWSNLTDWQVLGKELAASGRDVWLVELTGGPNQDCDNCVDYSYTDLTDNYWPALISGVLGYTGKSKVQYVGFSNGCRTGLDGLKNWTSGKSGAGYIWSGSTWTPVNLPANSVDTFVGVGCPGAFNGNTFFADSVRNRGNQATAYLESNGIAHLTELQLFTIAYFQPLFTKESSSNKISLNLWKQYNSWINDNTDSQPGAGLTVPKFTLIDGLTPPLLVGDLVVPQTDVNQIYSLVSSSNKTRITIKSTTHLGLADKSETKEVIKNRINRG